MTAFKLTNFNCHLILTAILTQFLTLQVFTPREILSGGKQGGPAVHWLLLKQAARGPKGELEV